MMRGADDPVSLAQTGHKFARGVVMPGSEIYESFLALDLLAGTAS
jgi:hypothetical protein